MRAFDLRCRIDGRDATFRVYAGRPAPDHAPFETQVAWLREVLGGEPVAEDLARLEAVVLGGAEEGGRGSAPEGHDPEDPGPSPPPSSTEGMKR